MTTRPRAAMALLLGTLVSGPASAYIGLCCAECGGNMPMNIPGGGVPETHELRVKLSPSTMHMGGLRDGTERVRSDDLLAGTFMAAPTDMDMDMMNVAVGYSVREDVFAGLMFMGQRNAMRMKFNAMMRSVTGKPGYTMRSDGPSDTMLMLKVRLCADDSLIPTSQVSLLFGLNLPTGSIDEHNDEHPLAVRRRELLPYGMQLGSGTFDPSFGVLYQGSSSPRWWGANLLYTGRWMDNDRDWRWGDEVRLDLYTMLQLRYDLVLQLQVNAAWQDRIRGEMDESRSGESGHMMPGNPDSPFMSPLWDPDHYGGTQVFSTVGFQWQPIPLHILDLQVGVPLYRRLNGPQLESDYRVMLTWYIEIPTGRSVRHRRTRPSRLGF